MPSATAPRHATSARPLRPSTRRAWITALALLACLQLPSAWAQCVDRLTAKERPAGVSAQLSSLRYACTPLSNGRSVWVGQAGPADAPSVLLVHGLGNLAHRDWRQTIEPLATRFHVITVDLPGFGASEDSGQGHSFDALDSVLRELIDRHANGARVHLVGHSLGGAVALHFAHRHPERVDQLVLVDVAGILLKNLLALPQGRVTLPESGFAPMDRVVRRVDANVNSWGRGLLGRIDHRFDLSQWLRRNPAVRHALLGRNTQIDSALSLVEHDFTEAIRSQIRPTHLLWGRNDRVAPLRTGQLLAARLPHAHLTVIDDAAHVPMNDQPAAFNAALLAALSEPLPARAPSPPPPYQGTGRCEGRLDAQFVGGRWDDIVLENCHDVLIQNAEVQRLRLVNSSVTLHKVRINAPEGIAVEATRSQLTATAVDLHAKVGVRAEASTLDFAGARIQVSEQLLDALSPSWMYLSVSEVSAPGVRGDLHQVWTATAAPSPPAAPSAPAPQPR